MALQGIPNVPMQGATNGHLEEVNEVFYETKLFRVLVARHSWTNGHVIIERKESDPHFYSLTLDEMEEFGYLLKKVSFWVMRLTGAHGFSVVMNDGTAEASKDDSLRIHVVPRGIAGSRFIPVGEAISAATQVLEDGTIAQMVSELQDLMQLPQE